MRGEDVIYISRNFNEPETPPRTWGRLRTNLAAISVYRNTPTHVGKTIRRPHRTPWGQKHPHARGEDLSLVDPLIWWPETPPRTWGRPQQRAAMAGDGGNTPTHVGKTYWSSRIGLIPQKHPHARGEDAVAVGNSIAAAETPPRTWGRRVHQLGRHSRRRNTPTHVGKTPSACSPVALSRKHPHARGEDAALLPAGKDSMETPPRTWGRLSDDWEGSGTERNTPTHVGKTREPGQCRRS